MATHVHCTGWRKLIGAALAAACGVILFSLAPKARAAIAPLLPAPTAAPNAHALRALPPCDDNYSARRNPSNPLALPNPPGSNPLNGANFFVDGPQRGPAAGEIARLLGLDPSSLPNTFSWAQLQNKLESGWMQLKLLRSPHLAWEVREYSKIASEPEVGRFSAASGGGGPGAILGQVHKFFCHHAVADPGSVPIFTTDFIYQYGYCESRQQILAGAPTFRRQINELAEGIDRHPAVMLLELDGVASSSCVGPGGLGLWEADLRYEINKISALPHTVVYVEGGYADDNGPGYTARVLNAIGIRKIRGFFTNDTHADWTSSEIAWGEKVSRMTGGAHFIVNTSSNGRGPLYNPHPGTEGVEDLCNPPGRGLGPRPTTNTGFANVDAFLWTAVPGNSSGCGGGPPGGVWWPARALMLARLAQGKIGPGWPNHPF